MAACFLGTSVALAGSEPAFAGAEGPVLSNAEGFGGNTRGGQGGKVIWVTNLNSKGPGSLRAAINTKGPRTIKFKVAGTIDIGRDVLYIGRPFAPTYRKLIREGKPADQIENPYSFVTIDCRGAPGPGITLTGCLCIGPYGLKEVIVRHLRIRDNGLLSRSSADCISVYKARRVIIDHCSLQWARDEVISTTGTGTSDVTVQWCTIGPGWDRHGYGSLVGGGGDHITFHHCLYAGNSQRNPKMGGMCTPRYINVVPNPTPVFDMRNLVVYNWGGKSGSFIGSGARVNMVGNLYIPGPSSQTWAPLIHLRGKYRIKPNIAYLKGNISPHRPKDDMDEWACAGYIKREPGKKPKGMYGPHKWGHKRDTPFPAPPVITHSAEEAKALVLSQAGAWPRDVHDAAIIRSVLDKTGLATYKWTLPPDFKNARPSAKASAAGAGKPLTVNFTGQGRDPDGRIVYHTWDFGDGHRAVGAKATHSYARPGEYVATFYVVDNKGMSGTASVTVSVGKDRVQVKPVPPRPDLPASPPVPQPWKAPTVRLGARLAAAPAEKDWSAAPRLAPFVDMRAWRTNDGLIAQIKARREKAKAAEKAGRKVKKRRERPIVAMDARVLHDAQNLYLRVICRAAVTGNASNVVAWISPQHGRAAWYRLQVYRSGKHKRARNGGRPWKPSPALKITTKKTKNVWQFTAVVPFKALGVAPKKGHVMGLKLMETAAKDTLSLWPPVGSPSKNRYCVPHTSDPIHYAKLLFP